jgi:opacity protein-like surface antigen
MYYADDLVRLLWDGNANYIDQELNLSGTILNQDHFLAYYINFGFLIGEKFSLGLRANLNQGLSSIQTQYNNISITTATHDQSIFSFDAKTSFLVNTSGLVSDSTSSFSISNYLFNFQNTGFSFDIGADFQVSDRISLNLSILDIGKLNWKSGLKSYESSTDSIEFSGIYADINSKGDIFTAYGDSLAALIDIKEFEKDFSTSLPSRIYAGLEYYSLDRKNLLSFTFAGTFLKNKFSPALSFGFEREVSKHFAFKISYSWLRYAPLNLGSGFAFNFKPFQFYLLTDNVFSTFLWDKQKYLNFRLGVNLVFPEKRHIPKGEPVFRPR